MEKILESPAFRSFVASNPNAKPEHVLLAYLGNISAMVADQRDIVLSYLGGANIAPRQPVVARTQIVRERLESGAPPIHSVQTEAATTPVEVAPTPDPAAKATPESALPSISDLSSEQLRDILLDVVSAKTGYPIDMLGLDVDMEAELSIDSIKKAEIVGGLRDKIAFPDDVESVEDAFEHMVALKTLGELIGWIERLGSGAGAAGETGGADETGGA